MPWWRKTEQRSTYSLSDPALAAFLGVGGPTLAGVSVSESTALGLSGVYRAVSLIAGTIASLPMRTLRDTGDRRERVGSFLDNPGGPDGPTPFEWRETVLLHLLLHGNAFLAHVYNGGGGLAGLVPIHPLNVTVELAPGTPGGKVFKVSLDNGQTRTFTTADLTHIPALSTDGLRGLSPIHVARQALGTAIAGDQAAARMFGSGALIAGLVTPEEDVTEADAKAIMDNLRPNFTGHENASSIAFVNRKLKFTPWQLSAEDAQFLQSRQFQIEDIARWFGIPPHLLMQTEKATSWGTGIEEQNRGLARHTLMPWTVRIEQRLSRLLPTPRFVEFDYAGYLRPSPEQEISLLIQQVGAGLITVNEARHIRNMDPVPGGDELRTPDSAQAQQPQVVEQ